MATNPYMAGGAQAGGGGFMNLNAQNYPQQTTGVAVNGQQYNGGQSGYESMLTSQAQPQQNLGMGAPTYAKTATGGSFQTAPSQMRTDFTNSITGMQSGQTMDWAGGKLQKLADGRAYYASPTGSTYLDPRSMQDTADSTFQSLAMNNPGIRDQWKQQYGYNYVDPASGSTGGQGRMAELPMYSDNSQSNLAAMADPANKQMVDYVRGLQNPQPAQTPQGPSNNPYMAPQGGNLGMSPQGQPSQPMQQSQGMQTPAFDSGRSNPWIAAQGQALTAQSNQNLMQNVLPSIGRGAQAAGMYGSSRQGTAEGQAMGNAQTGLNSALAGMYSQAYGQDQQYDLGLRSNDLGFANLDANINNSNFSNQLAGANFGLSVYDRMNGYGQQDITNATNMQNTPINYFNQFNQNANAIAGQGGTSTNSQTNPGNPYIGALGGLQLGSQLFGGK
jgi:hypothetical protein